MWETDHKGWTIKAECQRIDAFELWSWRRLLRVLSTARRSNQSILKGINPEYSLEGQMLRLKFQYFGRLMGRADSLEKTLILGKIEGRRRRGWQDEMVGWHHWLNGHEFEQAAGDGAGQGSLACCSPWRRKEWDTTEQLNVNGVLTVCLALFWVCGMWCLIGFAYITGKNALVSSPSYAWGKLRAEQQHAQRHTAVSGDAEAALFTTV